MGHHLYIWHVLTLRNQHMMERRCYRLPYRSTKSDDLQPALRIFDILKICTMQIFFKDLEKNAICELSKKSKISPTQKRYLWGNTYAYRMY